MIQGAREIGEAFISRTVTADETCVHHFETETKRSRTRDGTHALVSHWRKAVEVEGDFAEK
jgi:hypothetical protein